MTSRISPALRIEGAAAHETLRDSERHFQLLVQGVKEYAIFMLDPEGRIATWNSGAERIKGYRAEEIIGEHFSRFYGGGQARGFADALAPAGGG
jgi:PAS domain-containing protein